MAAGSPRVYVWLIVIPLSRSVAGLAVLVRQRYGRVVRVSRRVDVGDVNELRFVRLISGSVVPSPQSMFTFQGLSFTPTSSGSMVSVAVVWQLTDAAANPATTVGGDVVDGHDRAIRVPAPSLSYDLPLTVKLPLSANGQLSAFVVLAAA